MKSAEWQVDAARVNNVLREVYSTLMHAREIALVRGHVDAAAALRTKMDSIAPQMRYVWPSPMRSLDLAALFDARYQAIAREEELSPGRADKLAQNKSAKAKRDKARYLTWMATRESAAR